MFSLISAHSKESCPEQWQTTYNPVIASLCLTPQKGSVEVII